MNVASWDEWVTDARMFKYDEAGLRKQKELEKLAKSGKKLKVLRKSDLKKQSYPPPEVIDQIGKVPQSADEASGESSHFNCQGPESPKTATGVVDDAEVRSQTDATETESQKLGPPPRSEEPAQPPKSHPPASGRKRKGRGAAQITGETDEGLLKRPRINVVFPDALRAWLVDDWDLTTKQSRLFDLPARKPIAGIFEDYLEQTGAEAPPKEATEESREPVITPDLRHEFVAGLRVNFNFILGSQLLYKFERPQYAELLKTHAGQEMVELYGPMHLLRLLVKLRDLITFVKVDHGSVAVLEAIVADFVAFLDRNQNEYFKLEDYTVATPDYLRAAMC
ncbi:unnamed protein product [Mesocestoides corti]|uniref:MRG domain-containing protein n=1 Tax=Mesocestoides corti TaxID=53468 RepID=A0A3P6H2E3_MESCO|nr:unnamed protein product [Mesocestoides corti]